MKNVNTVLCADSVSLAHCENIGLPGENVLGQPWLKVFSSAEEMRRFVKGVRVEEAWIASSDDVDAINAAAAIKKDGSVPTVCLVACQESGSLKSRAHRANIDCVLDKSSFSERYARRKRESPVDDPLRRLPDIPFVMEADQDDVCMREDDRVDQSPLPRVVTSNPFALDDDPFQDAALLDLDEDSLDVLDAPSVPAIHRSENRAKRGASSDRQPADRVFDGAATVARAPREIPVTVLDDQPDSSSKKGFLIPVVSGSGGSGKSTVAAMAAVIARSMGYRTLLIDLDMQFGDMADLLGVSDPVRIDEVIDSPNSLSRVVQTETMPALIAAPKRLERGEQIVQKLPELLSEVQQRFDVIVANTGGFWSEEHAILLEQGSRVLFLIDQRLSSLKACRHALELCSRCGIATGSFFFALNRCARNAMYTSIDISCALKGAPAAELLEGGVEVEEHLACAQPIELLDSRNGFCASLGKILCEMLPKRAAASGYKLVDLPKRSRSQRVRAARRRR